MHSFNAYFNQQSTQTESNGITKNNLFELLCQAVTSNEQQLLYKTDKTLLDSQPDFLSTNSWVNFIKIEQLESRSFKNLSQSLKVNASKWIEYFHVDETINGFTKTDLTEKEIDLLNDTPFDSQLDIVQKLVIWLCIHPEKATEILHKYNVYNYGGLIMTRLENDLVMAYKVSLPSVPILLVLPKSGLY